MILQDIQIAKRGTDKEGDYFSTKNLEKLVALGNSKDIKCRWGHPKRDQNDANLIIGKWKNHRLEDDRVVADLELIDPAKNVKIGDSNAFDLISWYYNHEPHLIGSSIVYELSQSDNDPNAIADYYACDIVGTPAVNNGLFKSLTKSNSMKIKQALEVINKALSSLNPKQKDLEINLTDGRMVLVLTSDSSPKVGDPITHNGSPLADGGYEASDGMVYVVIGGLIDEIKEAEAKEQDLETNPDILEELTQTIGSITQTLSNMDDRLKSMENSIQKDKDSEEKEINALKQELDAKLKDFGSLFSTKNIDSELKDKRSKVESLTFKKQGL